MPNDGMFRSLFGCASAHISKNVILSSFLPAEGFSVPCDGKRVFRGRFYSGFTAEGKGISYTFVNCGTGPTLAGDCVMLLGRTAAKNIVFTGSCGGLGKAAIGDIIVCGKAFSGGAFDHYHGTGTIEQKIPQSGGFSSSDPLLAAELLVEAKNFCGTRLNVYPGDVFTTPSITAETPELLLEITQNGFLGIDMEISAVYRAASASGIKAAGVLFVGDTPPEKPFWDKVASEDKEKLVLAASCVTDVAVKEVLKRSKIQNGL